jgi:O-antigen ligase
MLSMLPLWLYLTILFVEPQLWVEPMVGLPVDFFVYPFWLLVLTLRGRLLDVFRFRAQDWFFAGMLVLIAIGALANAPASNFGEILENYVKWFFLYRFTAVTVDTPERLRQAAMALVALASIVALQAIQHLWSSDGVGWAGQSFAWVDSSAAAIGVESRTRWVGIFDGPGVFCVIFTIALPFALRLVAPSQPWRNRLISLLVTLPLLGLATFSTGSRGGFLTAFAIVGFWFLSRFGLSAGKLVVACIIAALAVMSGPAYLTSTKDSNKSAQNRVAMWVEGIEMVQQNPIFGIGKGNFARYTGRLIAHNSAIEVMGETGIPGFFAWFGIIFLGFRNLVKRFRETDDTRERELLVALGISVIGYIVSSLFVTLEYETFYFLLGLTASVRNWTNEPVAYKPRDALTSGLILMVYFGLVKIFAMTY